MAENKIINYKGADISYTVSGNRNRAKDSITFLHPAFGAKEIFHYQMEYFGKEYLAVAIDMIGHGDTNQAKPVLNMKDMPDIIKAVMDAEKIDKAHLTGVSLGSLIVQGFADRYPDNTKSVCVTGGYSIHKDNKDIIKSQSKEIGKWMLYIIFSIRKLRKYVVEASGYTEHGKQVMAECAEKFTRGSFMEMNGMNDIMRDTDEKVKYPLLLVCGEHDLDLAKEAVLRLSRIEECEYAMIENAGHCANIDNPDVFNEVLERFIAK